MKKSVRLFLGAVLCILLLVSCNPIADCGKVYGSKEVYGKATLSIGIDDIIPTLRTVLPNEWVDERSGALTYKLTGSKTQHGTTNEVTGQSTFTYAQISGGTAKISLDPAVWYLTLTAYQGEEVALVSPESAVDLTGGSTNYTFALKAATNTNATGDVDVTVTFPKPANFHSVVYGIYETGALDADPVTVGSDNLETTAELDDLDVVTANGLYSFEVNETGIKAGTYFFNANFMDSDGHTIAYYTEKVIIDGGNLSEKAFTLPDIFEKPPVAATGFNVAYSFNNNGMNAVELGADTAVPDFYAATFTWTDNSDNETGFELIITDETGTAIDLTEDGVITAGSLAASSETVTVKLSTGVVYNATFRAVNGYSPDDAADDTNLITKDDINLFTVTYNLNGGAVQKSNSAATDAAVAKYVVPFNASAQARDLLTGSNASFPFVFKTVSSRTYDFVEWRTDVADDTTSVSQIAANNSGDMNITAYWNSPLTVGADLPSYSAVIGNLLAEENDLATIVISGEEADAEVSLTPVTGITNVVFTLYKNNTAGAITTGVVTETDQDDDTVVTGWTWTIGDAEAGTYRLEVTAEQDGLALSNVLYIKVTR